MASQPPGTNVALFGNGAALPAHITQFFEEQGTNIQPRTTVDSLTPTGKVWTLVVAGQKTPLQRKNVDGDLEPLPIFKGVVLDYAKERGRSYYEGAYDPNNTSQPICWSDDGVVPHPSLPGPFAAGTQVEPGSSRKISAACANCPMAVKGSKVTEQGKPTTACSQHRMLAVIIDPALHASLPEALRKPVRLKIAVTSDWDAQSPAEEAQGWFSWSKYTDFITARGVKHTAAIVTKMKFDAAAAYPKIFFSAERPLSPEEMALIAPLTKSDEVKRLLGGTWTPAGVDGVPVDQQHVASPATADLPAQQYQMAAGETYTREQYHQSGWSDEQLIAAGKLIAVAAQAQPTATVVAAPPAPAAPEPEPTPVVVGEPVVAAAASPPAAEAVVVAEPAPAAQPAPAAAPAVVIETPPAPLAPTPTPEQGAAQAQEPPPAPAPAAPEPPKAAAAAAAASPQVSTEVPSDVASLLDAWGPEAAPAA